MQEEIDLRIHHLFDIIKGFGEGNPWKPHLFGHKLHTAALLIRTNLHFPIRLVIQSDFVCQGCCKNLNNHCVDTISFRKDFQSKEKFNDYLDHRIMNCCMLKEEDFVTPLILYQKADLYLNNILYIYEGNDIDHTRKRREFVKKGLQLFASWHGL